MDKAFGLIFYPGMRAIAYLNVFQRLNRIPNCILFMNGSLIPKDAVLAEAASHDYARRYFNVALNPLDFCKHHSVTVERIGTADINDLQLIRYLEQSPIKTWVFTGGGILRDKILSLDKKIIHVHPGKLPQYRGSTTFYYSLLENGTLHATAFVMGAGIDDGPILAEASFKVNVRIGKDQPNFMDSIVDPYIRSKTLERLFQTNGINGKWVPIRSPHCPGSKPYFVIHPVLRLACIAKINTLFSPRCEEGIFFRA